jgi:hypothetical protein
VSKIIRRWLDDGATPWSIALGATRALDLRVPGGRSSLPREDQVLT